MSSAESRLQNRRCSRLPASHRFRRRRDKARIEGRGALLPRGRDPRVAMHVKVGEVDISRSNQLVQSKIAMHECAVSL